MRTKKLLSLLLTLALLLALLPLAAVPASAVEKTVTTWAELCSDLKAGNTVKLGGSITVGSVASSENNRYSLSLSSCTGTAILDLNGYTLTFNGTSTSDNFCLHTWPCGVYGCNSAILVVLFSFHFRQSYHSAYYTGYDCGL